MQKLTSTQLRKVLIRINVVLIFVIASACQKNELQNNKNADSESAIYFTDTGAKAKSPSTNPVQSGSATSVTPSVEVSFTNPTFAQEAAQYLMLYQALQGLSQTLEQQLKDISAKNIPYSQGANLQDPNLFPWQKNDVISLVRAGLKLPSGTSLPNATDGGMPSGDSLDQFQESLDRIEAAQRTLEKMKSMIDNGKNPESIGIKGNKKIASQSLDLASQELDRLKSQLANKMKSYASNLLNEVNESKTKIEQEWKKLLAEQNAQDYLSNLGHNGKNSNTVSENENPLAALFTPGAYNPLNGGPISAVFNHPNSQIRKFTDSCKGAMVGIAASVYAGNAADRGGQFLQNFQDYFVNQVPQAVADGVADGTYSCSASGWADVISNMILPINLAKAFLGQSMCKDPVSKQDVPCDDNAVLQAAILAGMGPSAVKNLALAAQKVGTSAGRQALKSAIGKTLAGLPQASALKPRVVAAIAAGTWAVGETVEEVGEETLTNGESTLTDKNKKLLPPIFQ